MSDDDRAGRTRKEVKAILGVGDNPGARRRRWARRVSAGLLLVFGAAGGYYFIVGSLSGTNVQYRSDAVRRGDITVIVTATGTVEPTNTVEISSELSGIIRKVNVNHNSEVAAGDVLAELDTDKLEAAVASSRARLLAARARVHEAEATVVEKELEFRRKQGLADRRVVSIQELDTARAAHDRALAALESAKADVAAAEADLKLHQTEMAKSCICSPINGVVLDRNVDPGQVVASSLQAPVLFTIADDLTQMEVQVDVDEADVGKVQVGQSAAFTVDAHPDRTFEAQIKQLRFGSQVVQGVVTYKAVLSTDNAALLLRPGMTATAEIVVGEAKAVLTVSNEALRFSPSSDAVEEGQSLLGQLLPSPPGWRAASRRELTGSERQVWVPRDGAFEAITVTIGVTDGSRTQIVDGPLAEGQEVIVDEIVPAG